jgi:hypothetical protein
VPTGAPNINTASDWARDSIQEAVFRGFVPENIQNNYSNVITRAEFCQLVILWIEYVMNDSIANILASKNLSPNPSTFTDTSDPSVLAAFELGITSGVGNNRFDPNGQFNRESAATMILRAHRAIGITIGNLPDAGFADMNAAESWAREGINFVRAFRIMSGTGDNNFSPKALFTREQAIRTFNNILFAED